MGADSARPSAPRVEPAPAGHSARPDIKEDASDEVLCVEVAFALPHKQRLVALRVAKGTTACEALALADLPSLFPELPVETFSEASLGIFGKALKEPARQILRDGDRVEVYRPLKIDPKAARAERAARSRSSS
ncbi:MAG: RnfH family protein [Halomonas sp.]|nr:RnfH family protein [Halomonas sp.]|tara:strand:- start:16 stop:414 length:399 start_codon:yes stop_codon:yes gene_type:complete